MADTDKPTTPAQGDGTTDKPTPGIPDPNPTLPDASIEPAAQVASAMASPPDTKETPETVAPPIPADYEMPDDYAAAGTLDKAKSWAEAHPGLAVLAAAGTGLLIGRIVTALFPDSEPPSLAERVEKKAKVLRKEAKKQGKVLSKEAKKQSKVLGKEAKKQGKQFRAQASHLTGDAGDSLQEMLHRASEALKDAAHTAGDATSEGYEKTKSFAEHVADVVSEVVSDKVDDWNKR